MVSPKGFGRRSMKMATSRAGAIAGFLLDGTWDFFDSTGVKLRSVEYAADLKSGWERSYYPNGEVRLSSTTKPTNVPVGRMNTTRRPA